MIRNRVIFFIYVFGWCFYLLQGGFFPRGTVYMKILCLFLLLHSFYHLIIVNLNYKLPRFFLGLNILLVLFSFYGLLALFHVTTHPLAGEYLKSIYICLLPIYSFFFFTKEKYIYPKDIPIIIFVFFLFCCVSFYGKMHAMFLLTTRDGIDFTNNSGYLFVPLIAGAALLRKSKMLQYVLLSVSLSFCLFSSKRGAIIICVICIFWFVFKDLQGKNIKQKISVMSLILIMSAFGYAFFEKRLAESYVFQRKLQEMADGRGSGRESLYADFFDFQWNSTTPFQFILGSGANATLDVSVNYAHNDWLEIFINQGILGVLIYALYWLIFANECMSKDYTPQVRLALQLLFIIYFMKTLFSMSYASIALPARFIFGYCLAQKKINIQNY